MSPRRLFRFFGADRPRRREFDEEVEAHLELRADELRRQGWSADDAAREARRRFGDVAAARRGARARDRRLGAGRRLDHLRADVRVAARRARSDPGYALLVVVSLGLGIGLASSVFAVADRVWLRPLPYPAPDELVALYSVGSSGSFPWVSSENWLDWRDGARTLRASALYDAQPDRRTVRLGDEAVRVDARAVSEAFFEVLGVAALRGRLPAPDEVRQGARVAVVSERFWRERLGAAPDLPLTLDVSGTALDVVGVVRGRQVFPAGTDLWLPTTFQRHGLGDTRNWINFEVVARLAPDVGEAAAEAELAGVARGIRERAPEALYSEGVDVVPMRRHLARFVGTELLLLLGAVGGVLLLTCVNVAGLGLARTLERARELGVRVALGAGRGRIQAQVLTEFALLAAAGGVLGVALAQGLLDVAGRRLAGLVPGGDALALDPRALVAALALTTLAALASGALPAIRSRSLARAVEGTARGTAGGGRRQAATRLGNALVIAEVALAAALLVSGGLLVRSFQQLVSRDLGFEPSGVYVGDLTLDGDRYRVAVRTAGDAGLDDAGANARRAFTRDVLARLARHPAVDGATLANRMPAGRNGTGFIELDDRPSGNDAGAGYSAVAPGYFEVLGTPVLSGRTFAPSDDERTDRVTVVNRAFVRAYWPGEPESAALGRRVRALSMEGGADPEAAAWLTIVGVVGDALEGGFDDEPSPHMYVVGAQVPFWLGAHYLIVRADADLAAADPAAVGAAIRGAVRDVDPGVAVDLSRLDERVGGLLAERRMVTGLLAGFGGLALLLAAIGVYGLLAFQVARRTRELGVRAALGAARPRLLAQVVTRGVGVAAIGLALGLGLGALASRTLGAFLVDVEPFDPLSYGAAAAALLATAALAALVPGVRASRADPITALRAE